MIATLRRGWSFRPHPAATLATALLLPTLLALGNWQLHRAEQKIALREASAMRAAMPPLRIAGARSAQIEPAELPGRRVEVRGQWEVGQQILLDNQIVAGRAGYWVFTALRIDGDRAVLVNRGWLPADPRREVAPDVSLAPGTATVAGTAAPPPSPGPLARQDIDTSLGRHLLRVELIDLNELSQRLGLRLEPWTLRMDASTPNGYWRDWPPAGGLTPERHRAYALQWFLFAALLVGLYVGLNLRRS